MRCRAEPVAPFARSRRDLAGRLIPHALIVTDRTRIGIRAAQIGLLVNVALVAGKLVAGVLGHAYVLIADAAESMADVFSSLVVWGGLHYASLPPDDDHPFGHGKAEPLAAAAVSVLLIAAALGIGLAAAREIRTPHHLPAPFTLAVAASVIAIKWVLSRRVRAAGEAAGSTAVKADAWHHTADAISSAAAFVGISVALIGSRVRGGAGWESADDWAALVAASVVLANGVLLLRPAVHALMDRVPDAGVIGRVGAAASCVPGVRNIENLRVRSSGLHHLVDVHVQADAHLSLRDAHALGGAVKAAIRAQNPQVTDVLIHMEPYDAPADAADRHTVPDEPASARAAEARSR